MTTLSASRGALLGHCQYWARPEVRHRETSSPAASKGTEFHALMEVYARDTLAVPKTDDIEIATWYARAQVWFEANIARAACRSEVAYAWDPELDRGYPLQPAIDRWIADHPGCSRSRLYADPEAWPWIAGVAGCSETSITMTIDLMDLSHGITYVSDWCTGSTDKREQLALNALAVARAHGLTTIGTRALHVSTDGVKPTVGRLEATDLAEIAAKYKYLLRAIPDSRPKPGEHCAKLYCPAVQACPSGVAVALAVFPESQLTVRYPFRADIQSPAHAAALVGMLPLAKKYVEQVEAALRDRARSLGPIELADGKCWDEGTREVERTDAKALEALAVALGATPEQLARCRGRRVESAGFRVRNAFRREQPK